MIPTTQRRRLPGAAVLAGTVLALGGCALATATPPTASVVSAQLVAVGVASQQVATTLCVTNPNATALTFRRVSAAVDVAGLPVGQGTTDVPFVLPPRSATLVPVTVTTTVLNAGPQLVGIVRDGAVDYRIHGTVTLDGALGLTLPFSRSGRIDPLTGGIDLARAAAEPGAGRCS